MSSSVLSLTDRLQMIAEHIDDGLTVADIGTDHGYIPIWLRQNRKNVRVILSDVNEGPLLRAKDNMKKYLPEEEPDLRCGSGLSVLSPGEADAIILAGMGGTLIARLLAEHRNVVQETKLFVLQPRNHSFTLREFLEQWKGFSLAQEQIVKEGRKYCEIITVKRDDTLNREDQERIRKARMLRDDMQLDPRIQREVPLMLAFCSRSKQDQTLGFLRSKIRAEQTVIQNIDSHGKSDYASERRQRAEQRLTAFRQIEERISGIFNAEYNNGTSGDS